MTTDLDRLQQHPKIAGFEVVDSKPGIQQIIFRFTNGRGASVITGPALGYGMDKPGRYEIAATAPDGPDGQHCLDYSTPVIGDDVRRGNAAEVEEWILGLADLPPAHPHDEEPLPPLEGEVHDPDPARDVVANLMYAVNLYRNPAPRAVVPGEIISTTEGRTVLCPHCAGNGRARGHICWDCNGTGETEFIPYDR